VRRGEGCPDRERRISWSMLTEVYSISVSLLERSDHAFIPSFALLWFEPVDDILG
jgi:hypothetical protein